MIYPYDLFDRFRTVAMKNTYSVQKDGGIVGLPHKRAADKILRK